MGLENPTYIEDLNATWPLGTDPRSEGDDHIRNIKAALQASFPNTTGAWKTTDSIECGDPTQPQHVETLYSARAKGLSTTTWGSVSSVGDVQMVGDYTVARTAQGVYRLTFDQATLAANSQACVVTPRTSFRRYVKVNLVSGTEIDVEFADDANVAQDTAFTFFRHYVWWFT
jgi:hypothetical protein